MLFHHDRKTLQGLHPAPLEGIDPFSVELQGPCPGLVLPEMAEGLLEKVRLHEPRPHEKGLQSFPGLLPEMGLPGQKSLHRLSQPLELLLSHLVNGIEEVTDHVEFIVEHLGLGTVGPKAVPVSGHMSMTPCVIRRARSFPNHVQKCFKFFSLGPSTMFMSSGPWGLPGG